MCLASLRLINVSVSIARPQHINTHKIKACLAYQHVLWIIYNYVVLRRQRDLFALLCWGDCSHLVGLLSYMDTALYSVYVWPYDTRMVIVNRSKRDTVIGGATLRANGDRFRAFGFGHECISYIQMYIFCMLFTFSCNTWLLIVCWRGLSRDLSAAPRIIRLASVWMRKINM